jgi:hypothetical protein
MGTVASVCDQVSTLIEIGKYFIENFALLMGKFHKKLFFLLLKIIFSQIEVSPKNETIFPFS